MAQKQRATKNYICRQSVYRYRSQNHWRARDTC